MKHCSAPWYELNINSADNRVSACCYYAGETDAWEDSVSIEHYWNSQALQNLRKLQKSQGRAVPTADAEEQANGCSDCFYFNRFNPRDSATYFDFAHRPGNLSDAQKDNWEKAERAYNSQQLEVDFTPLRIYANFGYACNYSCGFCHQVPRRQTWDRQLQSDTIYGWREALKRSISTGVIGGEPFVMPEALKFIRRFVSDREMESVRLEIFTNGSTLHKHMDMLTQKHRMSFGVSLDGIGTGFEKWRTGGDWAQVEKNLLTLRDVIDRQRPEWSMSTNSTFSRACIERLEEFAEWHVKHRITTFFFDFINYRGTEDTFYTENIVANPWLLDGVPGWERKVRNAVEIFDQGGLDQAAATLRVQYEAVKKSMESNRARVNATEQLDRFTDYTQVLNASTGSDLLQRFKYSQDKAFVDGAFDATVSPMRFTECRADDALESDWIEMRGDRNSLIRVSASWAELQRSRHRQTYIGLAFDDGTRPDAIRRWRSEGGELHLSLLAQADRKKRMRVLIKPTGEFVSVVPSTIAVEITDKVRDKELQETQGRAWSSLRLDEVDDGARESRLDRLPIRRPAGGQ